jgi:hypothetical protein
VDDNTIFYKYCKIKHVVKKTRSKVQGARCKRQGTRFKVKGTRKKGQATRSKVKGARLKKQNSIAE